MTETHTHASPMAADVAPKEASFGVRHKRGFITAAVVGFILTLVGALETTQIAFLPRLAYWEILMISGSVIGLGVSEAIERWGRLRSKPLLEMPLIATLIAAPLTMMVVGTSSVFFGVRAPGAIGLALMFGITFAISLAMTALNYLMHWPGTGVPDPAPAPSQLAANDAPTHDAPLVNRFVQRLPVNVRHLDILALEAEDHYLRVHFADGQSTLILVRLTDAIAELPEGLGQQTHRSWWVARDAVHACTKSEGRAELTLASGLLAPVSRSYYKTLTALGWLS